MEELPNYIESMLMYIRGKPFSSAQRLLLYIIAGTTAINVVHCGFVWTIFFVCISAFLGSAAFLLVIDKREGGLVVEIRKFLQMYDFPVRSWLQLLRANALSTSETFETVEKSKGIGLMATPPQLSSHSLEKIYPWLNLSIPKVLDDSLTKLFEIILNDYAMKDWYSLVQVRKGFVTETKFGLRFAFSRLVKRLLVVDFATLIHEKGSKMLVDQVTVYLKLRSLAASSGEKDINALLKLNEKLSHPALKSGEEEDLFYYNISKRILGCLLPREYRRFAACAAILREVVSETVLKNIVENLSEPFRINYILAVALSSVGSQSELASPPEIDLTPVPLLQNLVGEEKLPSTIQRVPFRQIVKEATLKNTFEQHLKALGLDDFYKIHESMEWINKFLESSVLGEAAMNTTYRSVVKLKNELDVATRKGYIIPTNFLSDVASVVTCGISGVTKLRQLPSWKEMYKSLVTLMEETLVPGFQETRLYHHLLIPPTEEIRRKRIRRPVNLSRPANPVALQQLGETVRGALKDVPPVVEHDSEAYDEYDGTSQFPEDEFDDMDSEGMVNEDALGSTLRDLYYFDVTVNRAERRRDDRGRIFMVLNITVLDRGPLSPDNGKVWSVQRKYSEFYILDGKIRQFHGTLDASSFLPPKKAWTTPTLEYLQARVVSFERFLQSLLKEPKLRYSQMLYNFLATTLAFDSSGFPDLGLSRVMKNVPQILTSERGQNVESFIRSLLNSALPGKTKGINDILPSLSEIVNIDKDIVLSERLKNIPVDVPDFMVSRGNDAAPMGQSIFDEVIFLSTALLKADPEMLGLLACCKGFAEPAMEEGARYQVQKIVEHFSSPREIASLVELLCEALTESYPPVDEVEKDRRASAALDLLKMTMDNPVTEVLCGENTENVAILLFDLFQYKLLNKRLALMILDVVVETIFPEIAAASAAYDDEV